MNTLRKYHNRTSFTLYNFRISLKDAFCPYKFVTIVTHPLSAIKSSFTLNIINVKSHGSNRTEQRNLPWNSCRTEATTVRWINPPTKHAYAKRISFRKFHGNIAYIPSTAPWTIFHQLNQKTEKLQNKKKKLIDQAKKRREITVTGRIRKKKKEKKRTIHHQILLRATANFLWPCNHGIARRAYDPPRVCHSPRVPSFHVVSAFASFASPSPRNSSIPLPLLIPHYITLRHIMHLTLEHYDDLCYAGLVG